MQREKMCCVCDGLFVSHPKLGDRQKTCGAESCRRELKRRANKAWRQRNPDYFKGRYDAELKEWHKKNPNYKKKYRRKHPEYVQKNGLYVKTHRQRRSLETE